jgi:hypothetical protein
MNCPVCTVTLRPADRDGIEVDYCPQCHGVWIGREQLDQILARPSPFEANWTDSSTTGNECYGTEWALNAPGSPDAAAPVSQPGFWSTLFAC